MGRASREALGSQRLHRSRMALLSVLCLSIGLCRPGSWTFAAQQARHLLLLRPHCGVTAQLQRRSALRAMESIKDLMELEGWASERGAHSKARFAQLPGFGLSLAAGDDGVKAGDTLLRVPSSLHLAPSKVRASAVGRALAGVVEDDSALLAIGLLTEVAKGKDSSFLPYLSILPARDEMHIPLLWPEEERQLLQGSHCGLATEQLDSMLQEQWSAIEAVAKGLPDLFPPSTFNAKNWQWAHAILLTRALPFGNELSLIPGLDLANHELGSNNTCSIGVASPDGGVEEVDEDTKLQPGQETEAVLTAGRDHAPGEQIFIDYDGGVGDRLSWEMLYTYGFVPGAEMDEVLAAGGRPLHFQGVQSSDPLMRQKRALFELLGAGEDAVEGKWLDLRPHVNSCRAMAPLLRLAHLSKEDGALAEDLAAWRAEPRSTWAALQKPLGPLNERKVAQQVLGACSQALEQLPPADKLGTDAAEATGEEDVSRLHARLAARVLLGERVALESCMKVWEAVQ